MQWQQRQTFAMKQQEQNSCIKDAVQSIAVAAVITDMQQP